MAADCYAHILLAIEALLVGTVTQQDVVLFEHGQHQLVGILGWQYLTQEVVCL